MLVVYCFCNVYFFTHIHSSHFVNSGIFVRLQEKCCVLVCRFIIVLNSNVLSNIAVTVIWSSSFMRFKCCHSFGGICALYNYRKELTSPYKSVIIIFQQFTIKRRRHIESVICICIQNESSKFVYCMRVWEMSTNYELFHTYVIHSGNMAFRTGSYFFIQAVYSNSCTLKGENTPYICMR